MKKLCLLLVLCLAAGQVAAQEQPISAKDIQKQQKQMLLKNNAEIRRMINNNNYSSRKAALKVRNITEEQIATPQAFNEALAAERAEAVEDQKEQQILEQIEQVKEMRAQKAAEEQAKIAAQPQEPTFKEKIAKKFDTFREKFFKQN